MRLRFHWRLVQPGGSSKGSVSLDRVAAEAGLPQLDLQEAFCRDADRYGIDSLLVNMNSAKPEPMALALSLALSTERIRFMVAARPGLMSPTLFVQQVNTFSAITGGRISLNIVAGHSPAEQRSYGDHLDHDARYARMMEWLSICHGLWKRDGPVNFRGQYYRVEEGRLNTPFVSPDRTRPEVYVGGSSPQAEEVAARHADCWVRFADTPAGILARANPVCAAGIGIGLRLSVICRPTREAALRDAGALLEAETARVRRENEREFVRRSDATSIRDAYDLAEQEWPTPWLWTGLVRLLGAVSPCLIGTPEDVAAGLLEFRDAGVSQFILSGWPTGEEMRRFGSDVLPLVRGPKGSRPARRPGPLSVIASR